MSLPKNTETISVTMPSFLIELADEYCSSNDFSRSALITRAVRQYLLRKQDNPRLWEQLYQEKKGA